MEDYNANNIALKVGGLISLQELRMSEPLFLTDNGLGLRFVGCSIVESRRNLFL